VATFSLMLRHREENVRNARLLAKLALETGEAPMRTSAAALPGDRDALRGVPVVGVHGGRGGAIRGSRPGESLR